RPVLPGVADEAETFLEAPLAAWSDLDTPLVDHVIGAYKPLFTRLDPKRIEAMVEASRDTLAAPAKNAGGEAAKKDGKQAPAKAKKDAGGFIGIDDFAKLDLRIGKVLACEFV